MTIFPLSGLGPLAYFQELALQKNVLFEVCDHFPKQSFRSRFEILGANGKQRISIPVERINESKTLTKDIKISNNSNWEIEAKRSLKTAYSSSPYFDHYEFDLLAVFEKKHAFLLDFNCAFIDFFNSHLQLELNYGFTSEFESIKEIDFRTVDFEKIESLLVNEKYQQVYYTSEIFEGNCSILDALFNLGPLTRKIILPNN